MNRDDNENLLLAIGATCLFCALLQAAMAALVPAIRATPEIGDAGVIAVLATIPYRWLRRRHARFERRP